MPFQLKNGHHHHGAMEGKPPVTPMQQQQQHAPPPRVSRFRRLLVRVSASERLAGDGKERGEKEAEKVSASAAGGEVEAGSVGLDRMVLSFMEDSAAVERPQRGRCNCFNGSNYEESDDEEGFFLPSDHSSASAPAAAGDALESLKVTAQFFVPRASRTRNPRISKPQIFPFVGRIEFDLCVRFLAGFGAERERRGAESSRGRVEDRGEVLQGIQGQGGVPPRGGRRPPRTRLRRRRLPLAMGEDLLVPRRYPPHLAAVQFDTNPFSGWPLTAAVESVNLGQVSMSTSTRWSARR